MSSASRKRAWRSSTLRLALLATLAIWLLNAAVVLVLYNFTLNALVSEVIERIDRDVEQRLSSWPKELPSKAGFTQWLYRQLAIDIAEMEACVALADAEGEAQLGNIGHTDATPFRYRGYHTVLHTGYRWQPDRHSGPYHCLVSEIRLPDGGLYTYGRPFEDYMSTITELNRLRFWGLLLTGLLSAGIGYGIAMRALRGIQRINALCEKVAHGDLSRRLAVSGSGNDMDYLSESINHMLDQIEQLMGGIRQVSDAIAHDLKTPLARLRGQLELLLNLPERSDEAILAVIAEADQVLAAFNALLRIAQLEQGSRRQAFIDFDFRQVIDSMRDIYELVFADKAIGFQLDVEAGEFHVLGDRELWLQAMSNLLDNAYKYTPEGGQVRISLRHGEGTIIIEVRDSGPGIPEHEHANVFKRFYRLERHRGQRGTGLGLSLVAAICQAHHARIELANRSGLSVTIHLPQAPDQDAGNV